MLLSACDSKSDKDILIPQLVERIYEKDLQMDKLLLQLKMIPELLGRHKELTGHTIKQVTNIRTLCEILNANPGAKRMYTELHTLLKLYLTIPITTATAERTFSTMRRLKTYLRSIMTQERLNHVLIMHSYKFKVNSLDLSQIASSFISVNDRRPMYFGNV